MENDEEKYWLDRVIEEDEENDLLSHQKLMVKAKSRRNATIRDAGKYRLWRTTLKAKRKKYATHVEAFNAGDELAVEQLKNSIISRSRSRASSCNVPHTITSDDITIPRLCPVLGIPLFLTKGSYSDNSPSIDRIVGEVGYVPGNIRIISKRANTIKSSATLDEVLAVADYIKNHS